MKQQLTEALIKQMILGSSIYSTGGGYELSVQEKQFTLLLKKKRKLTLQSIDELADDDYVCTAYAVGSAAHTDTDLSRAFLHGLKTLENITGKQIKGIFAGETNIDVLAFQTASQMGLPVIDADCTGGRAVPEIQYDDFSLYNKSILPLVAITPDGNVVTLLESPNLQHIESFVRKLLPKNGKGLIAVLDHPIQVREAKKMLTLGIFQRAQALGTYIQTHKTSKGLLSNIATHLQGKILIHGTVTNIALSDTNGFLQGYYFVSDTKGHAAKVFVKNENLLCWINEKIVITPPDRILSFDPKKQRGVHNSKLTKGQEIILYATKAPKIWRTKKGQQLFHPKHFGFDIETSLLP